MPTRWTGTFEERLARLEKQGRRCDGNSRHCGRSAVHKYILIPADGHGNPKPGAVAVNRQACAFHKAQFEQNGLYVVHSSERMPPKIVRQPRWRVAEYKQAIAGRSDDV